MVAFPYPPHGGKGGIGKGGPSPIAAREDEDLPPLQRNGWSGVVGVVEVVVTIGMENRGTPCGSSPAKVVVAAAAIRGSEVREGWRRRCVDPASWAVWEGGGGGGAFLESCVRWRWGRTPLSACGGQCRSRFVGVVEEDVVRGNAWRCFFFARWTWREREEGEGGSVRPCGDACASGGDSARRWGFRTRDGGGGGGGDAAATRKAGEERLEAVVVVLVGMVVRGDDDEEEVVALARRDDPRPCGSPRRSRRRTSAFLCFFFSFSFSFFFFRVRSVVSSSCRLSSFVWVHTETVRLVVGMEDDNEASTARGGGGGTWDVSAAVVGRVGIGMVWRAGVGLP